MSGRVKEESKSGVGMKQAQSTARAETQAFVAVLAELARLEYEALLRLTRGAHS